MSYIITIQVIQCFFSLQHRNPKNSHYHSGLQTRKLVQSDITVKNKVTKSRKILQKYNSSPHFKEKANSYLITAIYELFIKGHNRAAHIFTILNCPGTLFSRVEMYSHVWLNSSLWFLTSFQKINKTT